MKKYLIVFTVILLATTMQAQVPWKMSYQGIIRNTSDVLIKNTSIGMQISILQDSPTGTPVFVERHFPTTNSNGLITLEIGTGTLVSGNLSTIDWSGEVFYLKTETDINGGANYTITGVSQLLSVPYALHSKTAETVTGPTTETDPLFTAWDKSTGIVIIESQISDLDHFTTDDETDPVYGASVASGITGTDINNWNNKLDIYIESDPNVPSGTQTGQMQYWNGVEWITVEPGSSGQVLTFSNGVPEWSNTYGWNDVQNPTTGDIWMDRNLGASQVATSSTDANAYGDLYQWGRGTDGHQIRTSGTTATNATTAVPNGGNSWDGLFITEGSSPYDWLTLQDDNLWQGVSGANNPCPSGYRLPTEAEWEAERTSWSSNDAAGAFASPLKLPVAGYRDSIDGSLLLVGSYGSYWSSTVAGAYSRVLGFRSGSAGVGVLHSYRAYGSSVRCLLD